MALMGDLKMRRLANGAVFPRFQRWAMGKLARGGPRGRVGGAREGLAEAAFRHCPRAARGGASLH